MTQKSCAVGMRNAILRNHLNKNEALLTEGGEGLTFQIWLSSFQCFYEKNENTVGAVLLVTSTFISNL